MNEVIEHRSMFWLVPSLVMNSLGGGIFGTIVIPVAVRLRTERVASPPPLWRRSAQRRASC
ncbi:MULTISPECIES: hypothetical protein [unclassified Rathayibacter]|uniref:hypothetical protein n=1 Tax=unclassified Rathayibacter TaxID=2609250 RepID=UPI00188BCF7B|nr:MULTISPECIES: hypothetical protein [unclassified Rathayibacter]MBF4461387.1 hypothetical protein [Rathayibacter sp. VKM Ac-2879]MBF4502798.1 hypothetical protein [Rathayibacter sp. VKM Ac-2878]